MGDRIPVCLTPRANAQAEMSEGRSTAARLSRYASLFLGAGSTRRKAKICGLSHKSVKS